MYYYDKIVHKISEIYGDAHGKRKGSTGKKGIY